MFNEYIQVFTTVEKPEDADRIASEAVRKRVAACAQILGPIRSIYRWKGKVEEAGEWLCVLKTRKDLFPALEKEIKSLHPYEVPEVIALPIVAGSEAYLKWIESETIKTSDEQPVTSDKNEEHRIQKTGDRRKTWKNEMLE